MILSDTDITIALREGSIVITPFNKNNLGSNSYDLTLHNRLFEYIIPECGYIDARQNNYGVYEEIPEEGMVLYPGRFYLGSTRERTIVRKFMPYIEGKSSVGRLGISVHETAGMGDIGFDGHWTLEISVKVPVKVYAGMPIAQIAFMMSYSKCTIPYAAKQNSKYSHQGIDPVPSKMFLNEF